MSFTTLVQWRLPHGLCVAVSLPPATETGVPPSKMDAMLALLTEEEAALCRGFGLRRLIPFVGGRLAMAQALAALGRARTPVLSTARGAPRLPAGVRGSISHKAHLAVALVDDDPANAHWTLGVDVECIELPRTDISREVLTVRELSHLRGRSESARAWELMARFSLKEALYKALDPHVSRFVGFREVEVDLHPDGSATPRLFLNEGGLEAELWCTRLENVVLSTARVRRR